MWRGRHLLRQERPRRAALPRCGKRLCCAILCYERSFIQTGSGQTHKEKLRQRAVPAGTVTLESLAFADGSLATVHVEQASLAAGAGVSHFFRAAAIANITGATHMLLATVRDGGDSTGTKKPGFLQPNIGHLPRQARDKHRTKLKRVTAMTTQEQWCRAMRSCCCRRST
eukprot:COSAG06_NODE_5282_length_3588_cov_17.136715_2_plen_170_part_00